METPHANAGRLVVQSIFERSLAEPARPALADARRQLTYEQLGQAVAAAAGMLRALGVAPGDRVVIEAANSVAEVVTHLSIMASGGVVVPLGKVASERLAFVTADCGARLVCTDNVQTKANLGGEVVVASVDELGSAVFAGDFRQRATAFARPESCPDALVSLMYTTGSTGLPKGVMIGHRGLAAALSHIIEYVGFDEGDREIVVLPLSHSFGVGQLYCTLATGGFVWVNEGLRPLKAVFDAFSTHRITAFSTTPSMLRLLLGLYRKPFLQGAHHLRRMVVNSEPLPPDQAAELMELFPQLDLIAYYGLTEASRSTFLRPRQEVAERHTTVGKAAPRVEIQTRDPRGIPTDVGTEGEICIRGPHLASGYWNRPIEQEAAFREGWLHTGDLGTLDGEGYLTVTGRLKDQINVGGLKVSAAEVEKVIRQHPVVADVAVTGVPDASGMRGEVVAAAIVAREAGLELREILDFCATRLEAAAQPQRLMLIDAIPRAETGKVLKGELQRLFESQA